MSRGALPVQRAAAVSSTGPGQQDARKALRGKGVPVRIVKYGSSVLRSFQNVGDVADDILRLRGAGDALIIVVSAFEGRTSHLLSEARMFGLSEDHADFARHVCIGEVECAAALLGALKARRVDAVSGTPTRIGLRARGARTDAEPESLDRDAVLGLLSASPVMIVPGYSAIDERGETVLLGRGGSDLSAVHIAAQLGAARATLIKDVDAVYDRDPNTHADAIRLLSIDYAKALEIGGNLIQPKALRHAQAKGVAVEIAALGKPPGTIISGEP